YDQSLTAGRELGHPALIAAALNGLGDALSGLGDLRAARAACRESLARQHELGDRAGVARSLESLAQFARSSAHLPPAVRRWGAAAALRAATNVPAYPAQLEDQDRARAAARAALGAAAYAAAWDAGQSMTPEQAVADALAWAEADL